MATTHYLRVTTPDDYPAEKVAESIREFLKYDAAPMRVAPTKDVANDIGMGVHTGLRKGTDEPDAMDIWRAISRSETEAWGEAARFAAQGMEVMGYVTLLPGGGD